MKNIKKYFCFKNVMLVSGVCLIGSAIVSMAELYKYAYAVSLIAWVVIYIFLMTKSNLLIQDETKTKKSKKGSKKGSKKDE